MAATTDPRPTRYVTPELLILCPIPGGAAHRAPSLTQCYKCGGRAYADVPIHGVRSKRRECATGQCRRVWGFPVWYGGKIK